MTGCLESSIDMYYSTMTTSSSPLHIRLDLYRAAGLNLQEWRVFKHNGSLGLLAQKSSFSLVLEVTCLQAFLSLSLIHNSCDRSKHNLLLYCQGRREEGLGTREGERRVWGWGEGLGTREGRGGPWDEGRGEEGLGGQGKGRGGPGQEKGRGGHGNEERERGAWGRGKGGRAMTDEAEKDIHLATYRLMITFDHALLIIIPWIVRGFPFTSNFPCNKTSRSASAHVP